MDCGGGSGAQGTGEGQGAHGCEAIKRKWSDLEACVKVMTNNMNVMKDTIAKENAEKSAKISRLMMDNALLERTVLSLETPSFQGPRRPMSRPDPFDIFPAEVWEMIIKRIPFSSDLGFLILAFPQLDLLVKKTKRTIFMFEDVAPLVFNHLSLNDMKNCRLVCSKWNQDVCTLVANWFSPNLVPDAGRNHQVTCKTAVPSSDPPGKLKTLYRFRNHQRILRFLDKMKDHSGNPFFGRILTLTVGDLTELNLFWYCASELVKKLGQHVWNLEVKCCLPRTNQITFYNAIQATLVHLPNLRYLTVDCNFRAARTSPKNMAFQIVSFPLRHLPFLQCLKLALNRETTIISAFTQFLSQQIRRLILHNGILGNTNLKDESLLGFLHLEHLEVELRSKEDISRLLKFFSPNLKELHFRSDPHHVSFTSEQLISVLKKFTQLEHLALSNCRIERGSSVGSAVQFPRLKFVEIAVRANGDDLQHNLDFLLWLPSLRHLVVDKIYYSLEAAGLDTHSVDENSTLKIRKFLETNQILESNIWMLIPSLELLEVGTINGEKQFTREMFENRVG